jgi:hypothetical protein
VLGVIILQAPLFFHYFLEVLIMFDNSMQYYIFKDYEMPFDEKGSTVGTIRKVQWVKSGEEPDETKAKLEIRKMYMQGEGERSGKGYTFSTENGPSELAEGLLKIGFGDTKECLKILREREDFLESAKTINDDNEGSSDGEIFDMRDLLMNTSEESEDEDDLDYVS